jgi:hypothetical protein
MAQTFPCPHCGAVYPLRPVLVGKTVRCTTCRQPFLLGEDHVARPVEDTPAPPPPTTPAPAAPARVASAKSERLAAVQRELKATLQDALAAAITSDKAAPATAAKPAGDASRRISPAVLTGEGERQHRERLVNLLVGVGLLAVVGAVLWLTLHRSPIERALDDYTMPVSDNRVGYRIPAIRARAWAPSVAGAPQAAFVALEDPVVGTQRSIPGPTLARVLAGLAGTAWSEQAGGWIVPGEQAPPAAQATPRGGVEAEPVTTIRPEDIRQRAADARLDEAATALVMDLIDPRSGSLAEQIRQRPIAGLAWVEVTGRTGRLLYDRGGAHGADERPWRATLLRIDGADWPTGWRILRISATSIRR